MQTQNHVLRVLSVLLLTLTGWNAFSGVLDFTCQYALTGKDTRFKESAVAGFDDRVIQVEESEKKLKVTRSIPYTTILTRGGVNFTESEIFTEVSDLIIGIDIKGNTQGHVYMIINGQRFDGRMFYLPKSTVEKTDWELSRGVIIRYTGMPVETKQKIQEWLDKDTFVRGVTCVEAACKILYDVAGFQNPPDEYFWFPARIMKHLAKTGLIAADGTRLKPEVIAINSDLESLWANLPTWLKAPTFIAQVALNPYTWKGNKKKETKPKP